MQRTDFVNELDLAPVSTPRNIADEYNAVADKIEIRIWRRVSPPAQLSKIGTTPNCHSPASASTYRVHV